MGLDSTILTSSDQTLVVCAHVQPRTETLGLTGLQILGEEALQGAADGGQQRVGLLICYRATSDLCALDSKSSKLSWLCKSSYDMLRLSELSCCSSALST